MADQKISQLNNITGANVDDATDELAIVDASANETKSITRGELFRGIANVEVTGSIYGDSDSNGTTIFGGTFGNGANLELYGSSFATPSLATLDGSDIRFRPQDGSTNWFRITASLADLNLPLDVTGDTTVNGDFDVIKASGEGSILVDGSTNSKVTIRSSNTGSNFIYFADPEDFNAGQIRYNHSTDSLIFSATDQQVFQTNASEAMRITSGGNVGIGLTSPNVRLDVSGSVTSRGNLVVGSDTAAGSNLFVNATTNRVGVNNASPAADLDVTGDVIINGTARIGNGSSSADMKLLGNTTPAVTVGGSATASIISNFGTGGGGFHVGIEVPSNDASDGFYVATDANNDGTVDTLAMKIDAAGNVGIKKSSPAADLDVNGDVLIGRALTTFRSGLTISAGAVTATGSYHTIDTEASAASDDLNTINGAFATGHRLVITAANSGRTVVVKDGTGNIILNNVTGDFSMDNTADTMELIWSGSNWLELSRSNNGA